MANIAVSTKASTDREIRVLLNFDPIPPFPAAEAITEGAPIRLDTTTGRWTNANGSGAAEARVRAIAVHRAVAGQALTGVKKGVLDGYTLDALAYDADVFLSDTDGRIADAAGTVSKVVGQVIPAFAVTTGIAADKLLLVDL